METRRISDEPLAFNSLRVFSVTPCLCGQALVRESLFREHHGLHPRNLEPLAATHVLAGQHVVFAEHVRSRFGEAGAVAVIGASGELLLLGADHPGNFVFARLLAVRTIQRGHFLVRALIKKIAFFHSCT